MRLVLDRMYQKSYNIQDAYAVKHDVEKEREVSEMFNRIFGGSDAEQLRFLEKRAIITIVALVIALVASIFSPEALGLIAFVMLFIWGWGVIKKWFGITTLGAIFSGNIVIGVILFMIYIVVAYLAGIVFAFLGVGRWIYLKVKYRTAGTSNG